MFSFPQTYSRRENISSGVMLWNGICWHLERIVTGTLCGSVVAMMNITCSGGSSRVFRSALNAPCDNMCTSSMIYILYFELNGARAVFSFSPRMLSTPLLEAPSISITSRLSPAAISLQLWHSPHGSNSLRPVQLRALAKILAAEVFPHPLDPEKRYACPALPFAIEFVRTLTAAGWPISDAKF